MVREAIRRNVVPVGCRLRTLGSGRERGKIVVSMWVTLDGFVAGPQDELDWLRIDHQVQAYEQGLVDGSDALLLGR